MNACKECGFELWHPVFVNDDVTVGLYSDARFPGRLIVRLNKHYDELEDVPDAERDSFFKIVTTIGRLLKSELGARRVNLAVLGNAIPHVHAHLIPRYEGEAKPDKSPWDDPRQREALPPLREQFMIEELRGLFSQELK